MIISDATALIVLINIDKFSLLENFVQQIIVPLEVYEEVCQKEVAKAYLDTKIADGFVLVETYTNKTLFDQIQYILDVGESAAITLAMEKKMPLIIDEKKGRKYAKEKGLEIIGIVGILRFMYIEDIMKKDEILEIIDKLNKSNFRISQKLLDMILD